MKKENFTLRLTAVLASLAIHLFLAWFFVTIEFSVYREEPKPVIITIKPLPPGKLAFPVLQKKLPLNRVKKDIVLGKEQGHPRGGSGVSPASPLTEPITSASGASPVLTASGNNAGQGANGDSGAASNDLAGTPRLKAPFDAKHYLKPETLQDMFRDQDKKRSAGNSRYAPPAYAGNSAAGDIEGDIIIDEDGKDYFQRKGFDISPWAQDIAARINKNWTLFSIIPVSGKAEVGIALKVDRKGQLKAADLRNSSSVQALDQSALNAIVLTRPLPPLPEEFRGDELNAYLLFNYVFPEEELEELDLKKMKAGTPESDEAILKFGLVKSGFTADTHLPSEITLGVVSAENAHFRLLSGENTVAGGAMQKGFNFIKIPAHKLFTASGVHVYTLDIKTPNRQYRRDIFMEIERRDPENSGQVNQAVKETGFGLAIFIENQLLAYHKKSVRREELSVINQSRKEFELERSGRRPPDPHNMNGEKYRQASLPVLLLPMLAYKHLVKPGIEKKPTLTPKVYPQLAKTCLIINSAGQKKPVEIKITVRLSNIQPPNRS